MHSCFALCSKWPANRVDCQHCLGSILYAHSSKVMISLLDVQENLLQHRSSLLSTADTDLQFSSKEQRPYGYSPCCCLPLIALPLFSSAGDAPTVIQGCDTICADVGKQLPVEAHEPKMEAHKNVLIAFSTGIAHALVPGCPCLSMASPVPPLCIRRLLHVRILRAQLFRCCRCMGQG